MFQTILFSVGGDTELQVVAIFFSSFTDFTLVKRFTCSHALSVEFAPSAFGSRAVTHLIDNGGPKKNDVIDEGRHDRDFAADRCYQELQEQKSCAEHRDPF